MGAARGANVCAGHKHNGDPCSRFVPAGFTHCYMHGGATPVAKIKAENMLALGRIPGIETLHRVLETLNTMIDQYMADRCTACGFPVGDADEKDVVIKACRTAAQSATAVLDRTGLGPHATLDVKTAVDGDLDLDMLNGQERQELDVLLVQFEQLRARIQLRQQTEAFGAPPVGPQTISPTVM